ncbi:kinase [Amycolatopsis sp. NPDC051061]|uniref:GHMP family kinase ATP-binding protein n=1 Tax=Amycolatopsis sp. NPDC051061 TaxID=3155042 RepID=UPI00342DDA0C
MTEDLAVAAPAPATVTSPAKSRPALARNVTVATKPFGRDRGRTGNDQHSTDPRAGSFRVDAHHGEILQGVFVAGGRLRRGLVTLPCPLYSTRATFLPTEDSGTTVRPAWRTKARRAADLTLARLGHPIPGGLLDITSDIPLCRGFGSSTADVTSAIGAVLAATGRRLSPAEVGALAVEAETASDSLMYGGRAVVFAHREGEPIEDLGELMPLSVLGFGTSPGGRGVDTLELPPARYTSWEIEAFRPLRGLLRRAVRDGDAGLLGRVATASTLLNQRHLPIPVLDDVLAVARAAGAAGVQVAHSGDVAGLIFDATDAETPARLEFAATRLDVTETWQFETER